MKKFLQKFDLWIAGGTMSLMVAVILIQVVFRFAGHPLSWPEEVARWMMIWVTFAGAAYSFRNGGLIQVDFFVRKFFPLRAQKWITAGGYAILGITFGYIACSASAYMLLTWKKGLTYPMTNLPVLFVILALAVGGVLTVVFCFGRFTQIAKAPPEDLEQIETGGKGT